MPPDPHLEEKVRQALIGLGDGTFPTIAAAARGVGMNRTTLYNRVHGDTVSYREAHRSQKLLSPDQERVLVDWCKFAGIQGLPLRRSTVHRKVFALTGTIPGKNWFDRFVKGHPELTFRKPAPLDPKRASGFNFDAVTDFYSQLDTILDMFGIPKENLYNEDEKGIQLGGGRKGSGTKYLYDAEELLHYKLKSDNLELVTVLECIAADGAKGPGPSFVVRQGKDAGNWFEIEGISRYA